ncbi:S1C family serine protease [Undibacterium fentianense]|uniref:Trypsin-like peptidase domain-containing protein n=1 Tax=Undibacterium fentianense TaxID=2828728 RepID=A0A941E032_9BURK|nr:S1C family serine protease [Undibacterium fentianense]MBR7798522.1 trypsin-like peptidase domain-containing protein [Undibacterium fentianense]
MSTKFLMGFLLGSVLFLNPLHQAVASNSKSVSSSSAAANSANLEKSVVKVFSTLRGPDPFKPWGKAAPQEVTGSGVVIEGRRILTNAHVVEYASQVQIQTGQDGDKLPATVVAISRSMDLAVLKLDDEKFFDTHAAVGRTNKLPEVTDAVFAYGYPTGGNSLSITKGIVSRIEFVDYDGSTGGLRIQIDAAINPGNSGGPVIAGDKMIGLAFSGLMHAQNIGYIIPNEEIELFLKDIADQKYDGKPSLLDVTQTLENATVREFLKLDKTIEGCIIHRPYIETAEGVLKEWDVVTHIGDTPVDNQCMVKLKPNVRVMFKYKVQQVAAKDKVSLGIVRGGKAMRVDAPLFKGRPHLIGDLQGGYPSYFVFGPIVFSRATVEYLSFLTNNAPAMNGYAYNASPLVTLRGEKPSAEREELVVVSSPFFPHKLVTGYSNRFGSVIYSINGQPVKSLRHLVTMLRDMQDELIVIHYDQRYGETMVLPRKAMLAETEGILSDNGIRSQGSVDMMAIWNAK